MSDFSQRLRGLDLTLFDAIPSETTEADRRALLGVHRAVMNKHDRFAYLEIGSHLGGSIQPYLLNPACTRIYSIDPRPLSQPDERSSDCIMHYPDNCTERMLANLKALDQRAVSKVTCFDADAREVDVSAIDIRPMVTFIDGEHTRDAVNSDARFCCRIISEHGVLVFHDFHIIYKAIFDILRQIKKKKLLAYLVEGTVFAVFLDPAIVHEDDYLSARYTDHRHHHTRYAAKQAVGQVTPEPIKRVYRAVRAAWAG